MTENPLAPDELRREIEAGSGCAHRDLSGFDFETLDGDEALTFNDCTMTGARLKGGALLRSRWINCKIKTSEFVGAELRDAQFSHCAFFDPDSAVGAVFRHCDLTRASFSDCNLSMSAFLGGSAHEIAFVDCQMRGVKLEKLDFAIETKRRRANKALFERCLMHDASLAGLDLTSCEFRDCALPNVNFHRSVLTNALLTNCNLAFAEIEDADFSGADLCGSDLRGFALADLRAYAGLKVSAGQQHHLLASLQIEVLPDER